MKEISILTVLVIRIAAVGSIFIVASVFASITPSPQYELIHNTDGTTDLTGAILLRCRNATTAESFSVDKVVFFLNHSSVDLRERGDITVAEDGCCAVRFDLTRRFEGNYTCGRRVNVTYVEESVPKTLTCK